MEEKHFIKKDWELVEINSSSELAKVVGGRWIRQVKALVEACLEIANAIKDYVPDIISGFWKGWKKGQE